MADVPARTSTFYTAVLPPSYKGHLAFGGYVKSLSSKNSEGNFDILPLHENFVSMILGPVVIIDEAGNRRELAVEKALVEASNNLVKIFVEF